MSSLGSLVVSLAMDTAKFTGDVGKAAQQMARLTAEAGKIGAAIGANIAVGAAALKALVLSSVDAADRTGELAEMIGVSTEQMSRLGYVAKLSAIDQETLASSMTKLAKISTEAASGNEAAATAFKTLGVSAKNADGSVKPLDQLLGEMSTKFAGYREGTEKIALAMEFFGKTGAQMVPFLNRGAEGIAELSAEAQTLGLVLSQDAANAAGEFNDRLDQLRAAKDGLGMQIARQLLPTLNALTGQMFTAAKETGAFEKAATIAATGVKILMSAGAALVGVFKTVGEAAGGVAAAAVALFSGNFREAYNIVRSTGFDIVANVRGTVGAVASMWDESGQRIASGAERNGSKIAAPIVLAAEKAKQAKSDMQKSIDEIERKLAGMRLEVDTQGASDRIKGLIELLRKPGATGAQIEEYLQLSKQIEEYKNGLESAAKAERDRMDVLREVSSLNEEHRAPLEKLIERYRELDFLLSRGLSTAAYREEVAKAQEAYKQSTETAIETTDRAAEFAKKARDNIQDSIGTGLFEMMNGNFKNIGDGFVKMLQRMVAEALAAKLMNAMFGDEKPGGTGGGGVFGNVLSSIGSFLFGGKAYGGPVSAGRAVRVGEHGPEVFMPSVSGSIVPERQMAGPPRSIVVNVQAVPGMSRQTAMQQGLIIGEGVQRAMTRNG